MARTASERRAARKRKEQHRGRHRAGEREPTAHDDREGVLRQLIADALYTDDPGELDRIAASLAVVAPDVDGDGLVASLLVALHRGLWERGWQPVDVVHVVRRHASQRVTRLAVAVIAEEARASGAPARAPEEWTAQLTAIGALSSPQSDVVRTWRRTENLETLDAWRDILALFSGISGLGDLQQLCPPPSRWGTRRSRTVRPASTTDARVLGRIRGLLGKAESTEFPEEAEALTAKAQELITRHAVDVAVLDSEHGASTREQVRSRRLHIDNPYPEAKVRLVTSVAEANAVRVVWLSRLGMVTMVGLPSDLDSVELLFLSLLVQATHAMTATGRAGRGNTRSPSFRRAFLVSYAVRIGERLVAAREHVTETEATRTGTDLVPVMRARTQAVDDVFATLFPDTVGVERRSFDAAGWYAGRLAADTADLASRRGEVSR